MNISIFILSILTQLASFATASISEISLLNSYQYELQLASQTRPPSFTPLRALLPERDPQELARILKKYSYVDPQRLIRPELLEKALEVYDQNPGTFANRQYLSVIDFREPSDRLRLFIIEMKSGSVEALHTAHGEGSDSNDDGWAESFSNIPGSKQSSVGIYRTAETYSGAFGFSLRLDGLSPTNSKVRSRAIVVHGWSKMNDNNIKQIRSWGCPAISEINRDRIIHQIKNGSLIFADN